MFEKQSTENTTNSMTPEQLDEAVAVEVMGWKPPRKPGEREPPCPLVPWNNFNPPKEVEDWRSDYHWREPDGACWIEPKWYSRTIARAFEVVEKMRPLGMFVEIMAGTDRYTVISGSLWMNYAIEEHANTFAELPAALCRCALAAVRARKESAK